MSKRIQLDLSDKQFHDLWLEASRKGFLREDPRKAWSEREKRECIKVYLMGMVEDMALEKPLE